MSVVQRKIGGETFAVYVEVANELDRLTIELAEARKLLREANAAVRHSAWWRYGSDVTMPCVVDRIDAFLERKP